MPFRETPKRHPQDLPSRQIISESPTDLEREQAEERRQKALTYLVETSRAKTLEEAERYLESLNRLKERLVAVLPEVISSPSGEHAYLFHAKSEGPKPLREPIESVLRPEQLDLLDPRVWLAEISVAPAINGSLIEFEDALLLPMSGDRKVGIGSGGSWFAARLCGSLSFEERKLLYEEYVLTRKELIEQLRKAANEWEELQVGFAWEPLFGISRDSEEEELPE